MERDVKDIKVAAMNVGNFLNVLDEGALVIVPGDRAAAIAGDLIESADTRGPRWYWLSLIRVVVAVLCQDAMRTPIHMAAFAAGITVEDIEALGEEVYDEMIESRIWPGAKALAERRGMKNISWKRGDMENLPLEDGSMDIALLSQALHHAADPNAALREAARILKPGGRLLILDLRPHDETWVREKLGDQWFGFSDEHLEGLLSRAGFGDVKVTVGARRTNDPFTVLIAVGTRSASARSKRREPRRDGSPAASQR